MECNKYRYFLKISKHVPVPKKIIRFDPDLDPELRKAVTKSLNNSFRIHNTAIKGSFGET